MIMLVVVSQNGLHPLHMLWNCSPSVHILNLLWTQDSYYSFLLRLQFNLLPRAFAPRHKTSRTDTSERSKTHTESWEKRERERGVYREKEKEREREGKREGEEDSYQWPIRIVQKWLRMLSKSKEGILVAAVASFPCWRVTEWVASKGWGVIGGNSLK